MKTGRQIANEIIEQRERVKHLNASEIGGRAGGLHPVAKEVLNNARLAAEKDLHRLERAEYDVTKGIIEEIFT